MFKKETEYAFRALVYIQRQNIAGNRPGIEEIAREIEAPRFYMAKILQRMVRQGFLSSMKGKGGGFYLDPGLPDRTLKEIIVSIEGDKVFTGCGFGLKNCDANNPCPLHEHYSLIRNAMYDLVSNETIHSLAIKNNLNPDKH